MTRRYRLTGPDGDNLTVLPEYLGGGRPPTFASRRAAVEYADSISHGGWTYGVRAYHYASSRRKARRFDG